MDNSDKQTVWENIGTVTVIATVHLFQESKIRRLSC